MKLTKKVLSMALILSLLASCLCACGSDTQTTTIAETVKESASTADTSEAAVETTQADETKPVAVDLSDAPVINGLTCIDKLQLEYATEFNVYYYEGGYKLIDVADDKQYLIVPEGGDLPKLESADIAVLQGPLTKIYDAATSSVSLIAAMNALDCLAMVSAQEASWTFDSIKEALKSGKTIYAGKYSEPDYETLINNGCQLAIESTMIYHSPDVKEMLETLGIPVLVEHSSYESNPLGRLEWIKFYGAIMDREEDAEAYYQKEKAVIAELDNLESTGLKVAYFYISSDKKAVVRSSTDYISTMIAMGGGEYVFSNLVDDTGKASIDMGIETFYEAAKDADILIYNGSIDSTVKTLEDLKQKNPVIANLKAVQEGNTWVTGSSVYQRTDVIGEMILDFHRVISGKDTDKLEYLKKLE